MDRGQLAAESGLSRSSFSTLFQRVVCTSPMRYVGRWRMHKARELLTTSEMAIVDVASAVGYESEWAFAKAYKRAFGHGPGAARRKSA